MKFEKSNIRPALVSDLDQLIEIEQNCFPSQWQMSRRVLRYNLKNITIYILGNKVVGYILLHRHSKRKHIYINSIAVLKEYRTKGIAKELLDYLLTLTTNIRLRVDIVNYKAINLYFKYNFKILRYNSNNTYSMLRNTI